MWNAGIDYMNPEEEWQRRWQTYDVPVAQEDVMVPDSATASTTPILSPAQQRYKEALTKVPTSMDYKPSKLRRLAAAISGGFAGASGGPRAGMEAAQTMIEAPYAQAESNWMNSVRDAAGEAGVEKEAMAQEIARRRALAYEQSSAARAASAGATQQYRNWQMSQPQEYKPRNLEEVLTVEGAKHPTPPPTWTDPNYVEGYLKGHPVKPYTDPVQLERIRQQGRIDLQNRRATLARELAKNRKHGVPASPQQQNEAEFLAVQRLLRLKPEYAEFYDQGDPTKKRPPRIKTRAELPKAGGGFLGFGGTTPAQESLKRELYNQFLADLKQEQTRILGSKNPQQEEEDDEPDWLLEQDEDEEE